MGIGADVGGSGIAFRTSASRHSRHIGTSRTIPSGWRRCVPALSRLMAATTGELGQKALECRGVGGVRASAGAWHQIPQSTVLFARQKDKSITLCLSMWMICWSTVKHKMKLTGSLKPENWSVGIPRPGDGPVFFGLKPYMRYNSTVSCT